MPKPSSSASNPRPEAGYRDPVDPPGTVEEATEPAGEMLPPSPADIEQLARVAGRERNRRIGLMVGV